MIDTIEMKIPVDIYELNFWFMRISNYIKLKYKKNLNKYQIDKNFISYKTTALYSYGFLELALNRINTDFRWYYFISVKYKPAMILHSKDEYALSKFIDLDDAASNFNSIIDELNYFVSSYKLPYLKKWQVIRIDYAFQFSTEKYGEYFKLMRKCHIPDSMKYKFYDTSIGIYGKNTNINVYDKTVQLGYENKEHIIRFEVQCQKKYLQHLKEKFKWADINLYLLWNKKIALNILQDKIASFIGTGNFMSMKFAMDKIENSYSEKKCQKLKRLLEISRHHNSRIDSIKVVYSMNYCCDEKYVNNSLISALKKLCINLLVIPEWWSIEKLLGLDTLCYAYFDK